MLSNDKIPKWCWHGGRKWSYRWWFLYRRWALSLRSLPLYCVLIWWKWWTWFTNTLHSVNKYIDITIEELEQTMYLVFLSWMLCESLSNVISPVLWSMMRTHSLAHGFLGPRKTEVCAAPAPSQCGTVTFTSLFGSMSTVAIFVVSTLAGLKSSRMSKQRD